LILFHPQLDNRDHAAAHGFVGQGHPSPLVLAFLDTELVVKMPEVLLDGCLRDEERLGDLPDGGGFSKRIG
jgi:hypothetical protein